MNFFKITCMYKNMRQKRFVPSESTVLADGPCQAVDVFFEKNVQLDPGETVDGTIYVRNSNTGKVDEFLFNRRGFVAHKNIVTWVRKNE